MENLAPDHLSEMDLQIDGDVRLQLQETGKWTKFISIVMFVACGLLLLFGVLGGAMLFSVFKNLSPSFSSLNEFGGAIIIVIVVFVVAVLSVIYYFLFNFAKKIKTALLSDSTAELNAGLRSLKMFFIITTVLSILSLLNSILELFR